VLERLIACALVSTALLCAETGDFARFARDLIRFDELWRLDSSPVRMVSTYDRSGGNSDGFNPAWLKNGVYTIAALQGPGVVRRFYTAKPGGQLKIYVDAASKPIIDMPCEQFFAGGAEPFVRPMTGPMGGANYSFFPIPYSKSLRIETTSRGVKGNEYGAYYQVTYQTFHDGTAVQPLALPLPDKDRAAWAEVRKIWSDPASLPAAPASARTIRRKLQIKPGESGAIAQINGPAIIDSLRIYLITAGIDVLRSAQLQMHWDGSEKPAVDAPVGDFFGNAFGRRPYRSLPMGLTESGFYSRFAMPFAKQARISILNQPDGVPVELECELTYRPVDSLPPDTGYFHAKWRRENVSAVDLDGHNLDGRYNYVLLDAHGEGRYVGANLNVFNRNLVWWGEGDPMIFVDDDNWPPSIHGTGTEEYFNDAWGFHDFIEAVGADPKHKETNVIPVSGVLLPGMVWPSNCYAGNAVFSFHLPDSIPFRKRIRVTIEHGTENNLSNDYASTAYWYAKPRGEDFFNANAAAERTYLPQAQWEATRLKQVAPYLRAIRRQLHEAVKAMAAAPTNAESYRKRLTLIRSAFRFLSDQEIPPEERSRMQQRMVSTIGGPDAERWAVMDQTIVELARRALPADQPGLPSRRPPLQ
jgi:Protein of unknown function (DUF2961)